MTIVFMNIPPYDHLRGHTVSILRDIMVPLLRIPIAIDFHQQ